MADVCNNITAHDVAQSVEILDQLVYSSCSTCILALVGIFNNCILLLMFYQLRFFENANMTLFWNLAIVDTLACISGLVAYLFSIYNYIMRRGDIQSEIQCFGKMFAFNTFCTISQRFALVIALDRLLSKWYPMRWMRYGGPYRKVGAIVCWVWSTVQMIGFLISNLLAVNGCIDVCMGCITLPRSWVEIEGSVMDNVVSFLIVFIYVVIPCAASLRMKMCIRQTQEVAVIMNPPSVKTILVKLRFLSGVYIGCFIGTMGIALVFGEVVVPLTMDQDPHWLLICEAICSNTAILNSVLPFYIWVLVEPTFRRTLFTKMKVVLCLFETKKVFEITYNRK